MVVAGGSRLAVCGRVLAGRMNWCLISCFLDIGDDAQLLIYDLTQPLPYPTSSSAPSSTSSTPSNFTPPLSSTTKSSQKPRQISGSRPNSSASNSAGGEGSGGTTGILKKLPTYGWSNIEAGKWGGSYELNNLAWGVEDPMEGGSWLGVVGGKRLTCFKF